MTVLGHISDNLYVQLVDDTLKYGGAWWPDGKAYGGAMLKAFYDRFQYQSAPFTLVDVGASTGAYALMAAHLPKLRVFAFEPDKRAYDVLLQNIELNNLQNRVFALQMGVADEPGVGTFHAVVDDGAAGLGMLGGTPREGKVTEPVDVQVTTVDAFCERFGVDTVDVLKIDTEGGEMAVLRGAEQTIARCHPLVIAEFSELNARQYGYDPVDIVMFLNRHRYTVTFEWEDVVAEWKA